MAGDIERWLDGLDLGKYRDAFAESEIAFGDLSELTDADLKEIGLPLGPRRRILRAIAELQASPSPSEGGDPETAAQSGPAPAVERRQLTVLFCDLIDSTALSGRLDPEDMRDLLRHYQDAVAGAVTRHDGYVANYLGDGVLAYFGWPRAYEDQAAQAARAGLAAVQAVAALAVPGAEGEKLAARVGIATGQVVVGDLTEEDGDRKGVISGETPNLAARLQAIAPPGAVLIGATTRRLLANGFELLDRGEHRLKGIAEPARAWQVAGERTVESRFDAAHAEALRRLVGREHELGLLLDRWQTARKGEGQVVTLSGEPGIGKSRLGQALRAAVEGQPHVRARYQCSPHHTNSALYPTVRQLRHAAGFEPGDDDETRLDKLEGLLRQARDDVAGVAPLFANLLSLPHGDRYGALELTPTLVKQRTLEAIVDQLLRTAARQPVLLLFEDAHWIDPTSMELLQLAVSRIRDAAVLIVVTHRPEWQPQILGHDHVTSLQLSRLARSQGAEIVRSIAGGDVPDDVIERIVARTDGVPLFIEELTKSLIEGGGNIAEADIPVSLQASLLARLDRLSPEAREVAQIGAVIGRDFRHGLLASVADMAEPELEAVLDQLLRSELVFRTGTPPEAHYTFKHALVQDVAYDSLLRRTRRQIHQRIATALAERPQDDADRVPQIIAHHFEAAGENVAAARYWFEAGNLAYRLNANLEASAHFRRAIGLIEALPDADAHAALNLDCQIALATVDLLIKGPAAPELLAANARAAALCDIVGDDRRTFVVTWGRWFLQQFGAQDPSGAIRTCDRLVDLGQRQNDRGLLLQAHHSAWTSHWAQEEMHAALEHAQAGINLHDPGEHGHQHAEFGGHDAGMCARSVSGLINAFLGNVDQAVQLARGAVAVSQQIDHVFSEIFARGFGTTVFFVRREFEPLATWVDDLDALIGDAGRAFGPFTTTPLMIKGWGHVAAGRGDEGMPLLRENLEALRRSGFPKINFQLALMADAERMVGHLDAALELVQEARDNAARVQENIWLAEIARVHGLILTAQGETEDAVRAFQESLGVARKQKTTLFELRTSRDLATLWAERGRREEAYDLLAPVFGRITEGLDTPDLVEAGALLEQLRS